ncbi:MAG: hypothetical protein QM571_02145 [Micrococcaceae bacterium]
MENNKNNKDGIEYVTNSNNECNDYDNMIGLNDSSSNSSGSVWFSQLVTNGGVGLPLVPVAGGVFSDDVEIRISENVVSEYGADSLSVMLLLAGDAYFEVGEQPEIVVEIPVESNVISVGSIESGYPVRVREVIRFCGVFTLQAVLIEDNKVNRKLSYIDKVNAGFGATNPYALFMI